MYSLLLAVIYVAFVSLGLPDALVGAGWPVMHQDLGVPVAYAGLVTMIIACGTIVSSLFSDRLTRLLGTGLVTAISVAMTAGALLGFSFSGHFWMLCVWAIPYGLGAGAVDAALNNFVALHYSSRHMNWLHCFWGVGASISPFIMGFAISDGGAWWNGYRIVGLIQVTLTLMLFLSLPLWRNPRAIRKEEPLKVNSGGAAESKASAAEGPPLPLLQALRIRGVPMLLLAFFAYCGIETTSVLWASTYLVQQRNVDTATAASFASLFLLGITAGRFLSGFVADRLGDRGLIKVGIGIIAFGVVLVAIPTEADFLALAGLLIAGFGCAPIYPSIIHATPTNFGASRSHAIIGIQMAAAYTGSTLMPPLFGFISTWTGMWIFPFYLALMVLMLLVMTQWLNRVVDRQPSF